MLDPISTFDYTPKQICIFKWYIFLYHSKR